VTGHICFDDVRLQVGARQPWRRNYSGGAVLNNPTSKPRTVTLGGHALEDQGHTALQINGGGIVTQVPLSPMNGLILLRHESTPNGQALPFILPLLSDH